ncbi:hypothetical protein D1872_239230 [compost metagenome]
MPCRHLCLSDRIVSGWIFDIGQIGCSKIVALDKILHYGDMPALTSFGNIFKLSDCISVFKIIGIEIHVNIICQPLFVTHISKGILEFLCQCGHWIVIRIEPHWCAIYLALAWAMSFSLTIAVAFTMIALHRLVTVGSMTALPHLNTLCKVIFSALLIYVDLTVIVFIESCSYCLIQIE